MLSLRAPFMRKLFLQSRETSLYAILLTGPVLSLNLGLLFPRSWGYEWSLLPTGPLPGRYPTPGNLPVFSALPVAERTLICYSWGLLPVHI